MTDQLQNLPPDVREKVLISREYYRIASEISNLIEIANLSIQDLAVAFSGGTASLSGIAKGNEAIERAEQIATQHPSVTRVTNGIYVADSQ